MFSKAYGAAIQGIDALLVQIEADVSDGLPGFELVGFLASEVREAKERVRVAIHNAGIALPPKRITVNLSPADVRKEGTAFDLPIAIAILAAFGHIPEENLNRTIFAGELSLDGRLNPVNGVLPIACCAKEAGFLRLFVPAANRTEGRLVPGLAVWGCGGLAQVLRALRGESEEDGESDGFGPQADSAEKVPCFFAGSDVRHNGAGKKASDAGTISGYRGGRAFPCADGISGGEENSAGQPDFADICGQTAAKRAIEIAVAGGHNLLFAGSPGSGKTMLARRIPTIMPELSQEESLELSKIYSVSGRMGIRGSLIRTRPFCAPHHTITQAAMTGGGSRPKPGEISLATHGVLFLDEFAEFDRRTLEMLRQPLEERKITVDRVAASCDYPASFMLVAAMNPCPCGAYPDRNLCRCTEPQIRRYQSRISRPILDRIDLFVQVSPVSYAELMQREVQESSARIRERVCRAREIQKKRYEGLGLRTNAELSARQLELFCPLGEEELAVMKEAFYRYRLSARSYHRIVRTARTIADLSGCEEIGAEQLCEALAYRRRVCE